MDRCERRFRVDGGWDPEHLRIVSTHPCYDPKAAHGLGRMHLPVAPSCNVKCNFCIRRFDCVNESRPGVTSRVLSPREALDKVSEVIKRFPNIRVVGIAGPGDPLCNEGTFETLALVRERFPRLNLCLSTNGLLLPEKVDKLKELGVGTITVTINAVDPEIGKEIYEYIVYNQKVYRGVEAARILLDNQLNGIKRAYDKRILVKVNTVLIPTINEDHIKEIAKKARDSGVFMMNIIPLIPQDRFSNLPRPSPELRRRVQEECEGIIRQMRHCRQCRADAIGLLREDKSRYFYRKPLRFAVASRDKRVVNEHFGHAREFHIYDFIDDKVIFVESRETAPYCTGPAECEGEERLSALIDLIRDCRAVLCSRIGPDPSSRLLKEGIEPIETYDFIEDSIKRAAERFA